MILDADSSLKGGKYKELNKYTNIYNIARKKTLGHHAQFSSDTFM